MSFQKTPMKLPIYLDHHATTPVDPRVLEAMQPYWTQECGNPASGHVFGWKAKQAVEKARAQIAQLLAGAREEEIFFTSGATESNNTALKGAAERYAERGGHLITVATEHKAVLDVCHYLETRDFTVTYLPVDALGRLNLQDLEKAITDKTFLISVMHANNEVGVIHPLAEIGRIAKEREILFHVDAAQSAGKIPLNVEAWGIDLLSLSAHKLYGPKGVGVLYVRQNKPHVRLSPLLHGGGHEHGLRSGTLNVPGIVGLGKACEIAGAEMPEESRCVRALRDRLEKGLKQNLDRIYVNGDAENRLPHNLNISFAYVESESLLMAINESIAVSSGSACTDGSADTSHVLKALRVPPERLHTALRFGIGRFNTAEEIDFVIQKVTETVRKLRAMSPLYEAAQKGGDRRGFH